MSGLRDALIQCLGLLVKEIAVREEELGPALASTGAFEATNGS